MDMDLVLTLLQKMFVLTLQMSAPVLIVGMVIGLMISVFQTVTQIQESTLTFVPKIIICIGALIVLMPWMVGVFLNTVNEMFDLIPQIIRG